MVRVWLSVNLKRHGVDPHLGHNLDTGGKPIQRCARRAQEKSLATELGFEGHMQWAEAVT